MNTRHACRFCVALQRLAIRRRDLTLIGAAERLSAEHLAADAEREAFSRSSVMPGTAQRASRSSTRMVIRGGDR